MQGCIGEEHTDSAVQLGAFRLMFAVFSVCFAASLPHKESVEES
jgi:hypothetical protein